MLSLVDSYQRRFRYLRLSLTDRCNFKCLYCLPNGYRQSNFEPELSLLEIRHLIAAFTALGVEKIRLTGGEPTLRKDIVQIAETISEFSAVKKLAITTNGYCLDRLAKPLQEAGVRSINISVDSLDDGRFKLMTGVDRLPKILAAVSRCIDLGFETVKLNVVLMREHDELDVFKNYIINKPISIRFIELMQTRDNMPFFQKHHISSDVIKQNLESSGWTLQPRSMTDGPAICYKHPDYVGSIGLIAPYGSGFCESCNRLRVTCRGELKLCLFGDGQTSLRHLLQHEADKGELVQYVRDLVDTKPKSHLLQLGRSGNTHNFSGIGG